MQHDQISGLAGGRCTKWKFIILQSCSNRIERTEALSGLKPGGLELEAEHLVLKVRGA